MTNSNKHSYQICAILQKLLIIFYLKKIVISKTIWIYWVIKKELLCVNLEPQIIDLWHNIDRDDRICTLCNAGLIGDEFHYLLKCTYSNDARKNFLGENYCVRPNTMKYTNLMSTKNVPVLRNLCQLIKLIFSVACPPLIEIEKRHILCILYSILKWNYW